MVNLQDVFLIILSLFANLKLMSVFYSWIIFSLQVGDIWSLYGGQAHYDYDYCYNLHFFILCDIWSTVENYFQKILRPPGKSPPPPFYSLPPKNTKSASPTLFANTENFSAPPPAERGRGRALVTVPYSEPQASSKVCRTWMMIMHIQGPSIEQYIQAFLRIFRNIFRDINAYSATLTGMQLRVRGEAPLLFLKIEKSVLILGRKVLIISIFGLNFLFKM